MPKVRYLSIRFDQDLHTREIPKFRAAVIEKTERQVATFHNHKGDAAFHYRYPLIQYKVTQKKASIVCLNTGTDDIHHLLQHRDMQLRIGRHSHTFGIEDIQLRYHQVQIWDTQFTYQLSNWLALNQKHYRRFLELARDKTAQLQFLNSILTGNLLAFAKGIDWHVEKRIQAEIQLVKSMQEIRFKGQPVLTFDVQFNCNISLPDYVGLGKGSSVGFGVVRQINQRKKVSREHER